MSEQQPWTKPTTRFVRHKQEEEDFRDLAICYQNLTVLCELFDRGHRFISSLIAVEIAKLVADDGKDQSPVLLRIARAQELQFSSSAERFVLPPGHEIAGKYNLLVQETIRSMEAPHGVTMVRSAVPRCWEYARNDEWPTWDTVSFEHWWDGMIVMSETHTPRKPYRYTRRGLIKAVRDAQGAHSRGAVREDELPLNDPNAFTFAVGYSGRLQPGQEVRHAVEVLPSQAAVRQVGEELLHTINTNNRAGLFDQGMTAK
ncbi:MAG TPA: hypothetical protein VFB13_19225 [Reyranella sp.]|nr:hypothetical protein [Reyranella sp.]